jgi:hypothetical protein
MSYLHEYYNKRDRKTQHLFLPYDLRRMKPADWVTADGARDLVDNQRRGTTN